MTHEYKIRNTDGTFTEREPTVGKWYAGVNMSYDVDCGHDYESHGELAEYVGEGEFYDEDTDTPTRMQRYDFIVEQN